MELNSFKGEFELLKKVIEEALKAGRDSVDDLTDIPTFGMGLDRGSVMTYTNAGSSVVGWVDDF
jgi:hypothetical protein